MVDENARLTEFFNQITVRDLNEAVILADREVLAAERSCLRLIDPAERESQVRYIAVLKMFLDCLRFNLPPIRSRYVDDRIHHLILQSLAAREKMNTTGVADRMTE